MKAKEAVNEVGGIAVNLIIYIVIIGALLASSVVTAITFVNISVISTSIGSFFTGLTAMLGLVGTIVGIALGVQYIMRKSKGGSSTVDIGA
jgi:uncharacterized Tic20 family protein